MDVIEEYVAETGSVWGQTILNEFDEYVRKFYLVKPKAASLSNLLKTTKADPQ
jgi:glutamate synthase (NADPH/NADH) large chain